MTPCTCGSITMTVEPHEKLTSRGTLNRSAGANCVITSVAGLLCNIGVEVLASICASLSGTHVNSLRLQSGVGLFEWYIVRSLCRDIQNPVLQEPHSYRTGFCSFLCPHAKSTMLTNNTPIANLASFIRFFLRVKHTQQVVIAVLPAILID